MADVYYADTSALAKRYLMESGSLWLRSRLNQVTGCTVFIVRVTGVELVSAISRRERSGSLTTADANTARALFQVDLNAQYQVVEVTRELAARAMQLAQTHGLRGYDAIQLAAALNVSDLHKTWGQPTITLLSADAELNAAAIAEGLMVEDPNTHP